MEYMKALIIGLGLIGGSIGLALKNLNSKSNVRFREIKGFDSNKLNAQIALNLGLVDEVVEIHEIINCDVVFICIPLSATANLINSFEIFNFKPDFTIIDLGSAKYFIKKSIKPKLLSHYISVHTMAGTERSGPKAAKKDLFKNRIAIFTDLESAGNFQSNFAKNIFINIGMQIVKMDSRDHDKHVAYISHLPHILSFALAHTVLNQESPENILALIGGGFKDMIRLSNSSSNTWSDIFQLNKEYLLKSIQDFNENIKIIENLIMKEKWEELKDWIKYANNIHSFLQ